MTKKKSASKSKAKKSTGLPKKVAGVKVPKAVRESSSLATLFNSALGRELLADALIAAAGAAAAALTRTRAAKDAGKAVADAGSAASDGIQTAAGAVANVVSEAARNILPASLVGSEEEKQGTENRPRYVNKSSDHSSRKISKSEGEMKAGKRAKKD